MTIWEPVGGGKSGKSFTSFITVVIFVWFPFAFTLPLPQQEEERFQSLERALLFAKFWKLSFVICQLNKSNIHPRYWIHSNRQNSTTIFKQLSFTQLTQIEFYTQKKRRQCSFKVRNLFRPDRYKLKLNGYEKPQSHICCFCSKKLISAQFSPFCK